MISFNFGHSDKDRDHKDYDDIDGDGDGVGHSHINSDYDEYDFGDYVSKALCQWFLRALVVILLDAVNQGGKSHLVKLLQLVLPSIMIIMIHLVNISAISF